MGNQAPPLQQATGDPVRPSGPWEKGENMQSRRALVVAALALMPVRGNAQAAGFIGNWQGDVPGISAARLFITAVRPNGQVEGRMEFDLQSFVSTFGDKFDPAKNINHGVASGSV